MSVLYSKLVNSLIERLSNPKYSKEISKFRSQHPRLRAFFNDLVGRIDKNPVLTLPMKKFVNYYIVNARGGLTELFQGREA